MTIKYFSVEPVKSSFVFEAITTMTVKIDLSKLTTQIPPGTRIVLDIEENFVKETADYNESPILANPGFFTYDIPYYADFNINAQGGRIRFPGAVNMPAVGSISSDPIYNRGLAQETFSVVSSINAVPSIAFEFDFAESQNLHAVKMCSDSYYIYHHLGDSSNDYRIVNKSTGGYNSFTFSSPYSVSNFAQMDMTDDRFVISVPNFGGIVYYYNINGNLIRSITANATNFGRQVELNNNNDVAISDNGSNIRVYNSSGSLIRTITPPSGYGTLQHVAINNTYVATIGAKTGNQYDVLVFNISTGSLVKTITEPSNLDLAGFTSSVVKAIQLNDNNNLAVMYYNPSTTHDEQIHVYDVTSSSSTPQYTITDPNTIDFRDLGTQWRLTNNYVAVEYSDDIRVYEESNGNLERVLTKTNTDANNINSNTVNDLHLSDMSDGIMMINAELIDNPTEYHIGTAEV